MERHFYNGTTRREEAALTCHELNGRRRWMVWDYYTVMPETYGEYERALADYEARVQQIVHSYRSLKHGK